MTNRERLQPSAVPGWVNAADAVSLGLVAVAAAIFVTGGLRGRVHGVLISFTTEWRPVLWAALVSVARHLAYRWPTLVDRLRAWVEAVTRSRLYRRLTAGDPMLADDAWGTPCGRITAVEIALVAILMIGLTALMLQAQLAHLGSVRDPGDPLFSIWRLSWIAHQLPRDPLHLFDGNIFYPERNTLAFSDSILLPGAVGAPLVWLGVAPVVVYNLLVLAAFPASGMAMYLLVRALTGRRSAALVAAAIYAFYPFRFEHYSHFELQFSCWMPLALLALHRVLSRGRLRDGALTGAAIGAQALSSLYFAAYFVVYLVPVWGALALGWNRVRASVKPLLAGALVAFACALPMVVPYLTMEASVGTRIPAEVAFYDAKPQQYLVPHPTRTTYANVLSRAGGQAEKDMFPGILVVALALVALWPPLSVPRIAYALGLVCAFEASLGMHGWTFSFLYRNFIPFRGFRVPARFSMLVGLSLSILAGYGVARLAARLRARSLEYAVAAVLVAVVLFESRASLTFQPVPHVAPIYAWLGARPPAVVAELPAAATRPEELWKDARYSYLSVFHWQRILNGNSGYFPPSNLIFCDAMQTFPDDGSVRLLESRGVEYVVLHEEFYGRERYRGVIDAIDRRPEFGEVTRATVAGYEARIYRLSR